MKPLLLATDGSSTATAAAATAIDLAATLKATLVVVAVWDAPYTGLGYAPLPAVLDVAGGAEQRANDAVAAVVARAGEAKVRVEPVVRRGFPVHEICSVAQSRDARLIVIGSHGWGSAKRALFGSVSRGVLREASCPVLVIPARKSTTAIRPSQKTHLEV